MTTMAMAHPRRYFSLSAAGAIAIRLPATSSRMYTSSVSDPLANTSKTPSAASSVASGCSVIICATASLAAHAAGEPFVARRAVFEYLLDHPEFAAHVTRTLRIARYRIWREPDGLWLDDGWGTVGRFAVVYAGNGTRVMHARGHYKHWLLPSIHGQAVVVIAYGVQPAADGKSLISAAVTGFVKLENPLVEMASRLLSRTARAKAEREARQLVKVFARTTRAIEHDPAGVHELLRLRPDVSRPELEAFRQLLRLP